MSDPTILERIREARATLPAGVTADFILLGSLEHDERAAQVARPEADNVRIRKRLASAKLTNTRLRRALRYNTPLTGAQRPV